MDLEKLQQLDMNDAKGKNKLPAPLDMKELTEKAKLLSPEQIKEKVKALNRIIQIGGQTHEIQVVVNPTINTWACARVPKKQVQRDGKVVETNYHHYFIMLPFAHLAIDDNKFILGELRHELGHALYTDWRMNQRVTEWVEKQGYPKEAISPMLNTIEDPRMEHVSVFPLHQNGYIRDWFWQKNKKLILGNIGEGISKMDPVSQYDFIIKLYSLWALHQKNAEAENIEPWNEIENLHPDVQAAWEKIKQVIDKLVGVGDNKIPEMRSTAMEKAVREVLWPVKKELIDKHGMPKPQEQEGGEGEPGEGEEGQQGEPGEGEGKKGKPGKPQEGGQPGDPDNIDNLPPELQKQIKQAIENYNRNIENQSKAQIEQNKAIEAANKKIDEERNNRLKKLDGINSAEVRKKYNELLRDALVIKNGMRKLFEKYFPKISFPKNTHGIRGKSYDVREHLKRFGTGLEKPMATPNIPEKAGFVLQVIIDVSGSMIGARIEETIKTAIGILEAAKDYPIFIEVLASDEKHGGIDSKYILKTFDEEFSGSESGKIKTRLIDALTGFGGMNKDAESLKWAVPRIVKKRRELSSEYEKLSSLVIFLSDASEPGQQDPDVVNALRKQIPILGGVVDPNPRIKEAVQAAYGPEGEGSFCPSTLSELPRAFEKAIRRKISMMFRK